MLNAADIFGSLGNGSASKAFGNSSASANLTQDLGGDDSGRVATPPGPGPADYVLPGVLVLGVFMLVLVAIKK